MRRLPFEYAVRNLGRRPLRTALAALSAAVAAGALTAATSFGRGVDRGFSGAAQADAAIFLSAVAERDVVRSTTVSALPELIVANVRGVKHVHGVPAVSGELHLGTYVRLGERAPDSSPDPEYPAFVRGVSDRAFLVHEAVTLLEGRPPGVGEVMVGRLAARQAGAPEDAFAVGRSLRFETGVFRVSGRFAAPGTTIESELWTPVDALKGLVRRDDLSATFARMEDPADLEDFELFAKRRLDLELTVVPSTVYYRELADYLAPLARLAWLMAGLVAIAAVCGGANVFNAAVQDRLGELAVLRTMGYPVRALASSLLSEAALVAAAGGLVGLKLAEAWTSGAAVRLAMSAVELRVDAASTLTGLLGSVLLGVAGAAPAVWRAARLSPATALKEA
ncbi:MAG TPA: FtsX-like permease family protein [Planctomycetota bacterium]|nr:FtsX-like permease family protein [Planctomycetota bacterium]